VGEALDDLSCPTVATNPDTFSECRIRGWVVGTATFDYGGIVGDEIIGKSEIPGPCRLTANETFRDVGEDVDKDDINVAIIVTGVWDTIRTIAIEIAKIDVGINLPEDLEDKRAVFIWTIGGYLTI
jgi:hypothetical protein